MLKVDIASTTEHCTCCRYLHTNENDMNGWCGFNRTLTTVNGGIRYIDTIGNSTYAREIRSRFFYN